MLKHIQTVHPESLDDITVCVIIKWLWQVVLAQAAFSASVPHSASLVEFLWELMGRSGRGSQTSAVCESDRADNVQVWTGRGRKQEEMLWSGPLTSVLMIWREGEAEKVGGNTFPTCNGRGTVGLRAHSVRGNSSKGQEDHFSFIFHYFPLFFPLIFLSSYTLRFSIFKHW